MEQPFGGHTRRDAVALVLGSAAATLVAGAARAQAPAIQSDGRTLGYSARQDDWDWLVGSWKVRHRKLKERLVGSDEWLLFDGTCVNWPLLGGLGNVDDNVFAAPGGEYRGVGLRALDPETALWSIWWLDSRAPERIDTPVRGGFKDGVGTFLSQDSWNGTPVTVRFRWLGITANSAVWEQAFSTDGGASWEVNWVMQFRRA